MGSACNELLPVPDFKTSLLPLKSAGTWLVGVWIGDLYGMAILQSPKNNFPEAEIVRPKLSIASGTF